MKNNLAKPFFSQYALLLLPKTYKISYQSAVLKEEQKETLAWKGLRCLRGLVSLSVSSTAIVIWKVSR